ncbi:helix-turn-helix transcriptional regulator [Nocardia araoensis]|uniref:helix-turn-helix transcriptional regulator n=1 Tax=Nocardia araoensis TaxID=228600 RepID=UPI000584A777|nr:AraC family transcriptional regulator [Nocardia araoensis]
MTAGTYIVDSTDTRDVARGERADYWTERVVAYQGLIRCDYHDRADFHGRALRQRSADYALVVWEADEARYRRTHSEIRATTDDACRLVFPLQGDLRLITEAGDAHLNPGSAVLATASDPFELRHPSTTTSLVMRIPHHVIHHRLGPIPRSATVLNFTTGLGRVVREMACGVFDERDRLSRTEFDTAADGLTELLCMLILGDDRPTSQPHLVEVADTIRRYVRRHAADPTLDGHAVANALGWSLRQIQHVLQQVGTTPRQLIKAERLNLARQRLRSPEYQHITITELAYQLGFSSVGAFSNAYREHFGHRPSEARDVECP